VLGKLLEIYSEKPIGLGITAKGASVVEILVSESGTFSIILTTKDLNSCMIAAGESWEFYPLEIIAKGPIL